MHGNKLIVSLSGNAKLVDEALSKGALKSTNIDVNNDLITLEYCMPIVQSNTLKSTETVGKEASYTGNSRRVVLTLKATNIVGFLPIYQNAVVVAWECSDTKKFSAIVSNYSKSMWGGYRSYKTICVMKDVEMIVDNYYASELYRESNGEVNTMTITWKIRSEVWTEPPSYFLSHGGYVASKPIVALAVGKATNRGVGYWNFAVIE